MFQYLVPVAGIPSRAWMMIARDPDYRLLIRVAIIVRRNRTSFRGYTSHYSTFISDIAFSRALYMNDKIVQIITNSKLQTKELVKIINYTNKS